jgi:hypothetical protein
MHINPSDIGFDNPDSIENLEASAAETMAAYMRRRDLEVLHTNPWRGNYSPITGYLEAPDLSGHSRR